MNENQDQPTSQFIIDVMSAVAQVKENYFAEGKEVETCALLIIAHDNKPHQTENYCLMMGLNDCLVTAVSETFLEKEPVHQIIDEAHEEAMRKILF